ncbi:GMP synthase (glutamine-hydrolyzing) [Salix suchowensis]|nr:GMP synthase (glutamine-hydrolyzing) [Salix suchowensis]
MAEIHDQFDTVLILDFGSQYSHLITRRCREHKVYAELMPCTTNLKDVHFKPKVWIILSGSPYSVYDKDSPHVDPEVFSFGVPILGICYGLQVWMSHGDQLSELPPNFHVIGKTSSAPFAAIFHPEVTHSPRGKEVIGKFILNICGCQQNWTMEEFIGKEITRIREICGPKGRVIGAVSGGVDSTVAAKLMHEAIGDRKVVLGAISQQVFDMLNRDLGVNLTVVDASDLFLSRLDGIEDPEKKRKIIGNTFINVFEEEAAKIEAEAEEEEKKGAEAKGLVEWLLQGTLYPDVIESISFKGPSATIKTHHNVGGLLKDMKLKLIEPLRELFKVTFHPRPLVQRHPFPGPGLAIRILGPVTQIRKAGLYDQISQAFAVLLPVKAVGVMGDARTYEQVIALRAVQSEDFMTADWYVLKRISSRITNEVSGINRVTYDISSKPPAVSVPMCSA